ncbi:FecR family protein [Glacieibacterium megasporae]|uniref:FecR family protein n=1 Tax=Glacieibacterium megasporae TaxID=2835787 RepID=UPI001C1E0C39|nr:FecR domain-containing protein [Polymorphobacter megasporae]UAJ12458.1 FecR domain-containing protein [Polymorphobacter megasporae]
MIREVLTLAHLQELDATEAAALLLVRQDMFDDESDDLVFTAWIDADPANGEAWARACQLWELTGDAPELQALRDAPPAVELRHSAPRRSVQRYAIAASIAVALVCGTTLLVRSPAGPVTPQLASADAPSVMLATAIGERRSFTLPDTSRVTLNTDTAIRVAFRPGGERRLELLHGQAAFAVFHDRTRPFVVAVGRQSVTALGTHFEVRAEPGLMRVVLVEGSVAVRAGRTNRPPSILKPGEALTARGDAEPEVTRADVDAVGDWQRGVVTFRDTPLSAAAVELDRYTPVQLVISDPKIAGYRVSGSFHTDDPARFARTLAELYPVRVVAAGSHRLEIVAATPPK